MSNLEILILSLAMSIDALLVSFSYGLVVDRKRLLNSLLLAGFFGLFQFLMPVIGWHLSSVVYNQLQMYSKFIVFAVFMFLGINFIKSCFGKEEKEKIDCISLYCVIGLSFATSIDALAAGVSIKFENLDILFPAISIGCVTFILSFIGFWITKLFVKLPTKVVSSLGAILLFYLAIKALF